jgi:hypothetical protein
LIFTAENELNEAKLKIRNMTQMNNELQKRIEKNEHEYAESLYLKNAEI